MGMSGRNVFVDTLPKRKSGESGMALMWRNGKACNAKMDGMSAVHWQCQCRTAAEEYNCVDMAGETVAAVGVSVVVG